MATRRGKGYVRGQNAIFEVLPLNDWDAVLDQFEASAEGAIRYAAQAAAQVLYDEVKSNVNQIKSVTGNLNKSIYQAFSPEKSIETPNGYSRVEYHVSWNTLKAPHGGLIEGGFLQRYRQYQNAQGQIRTMVRPGMDGKKKPAKNASQSEKDAYYVTLDKPRQIAGKFFVRRAMDKFPQAAKAAQIALAFAMNGGFGVGNEPIQVTNEP